MSTLTGGLTPPTGRAQAQSPSAARLRHSHIFQPDPFAHYVERPWCNSRLFEAESFGAPRARVLDPAAGWCQIPRAAAAAGYSAIASDIIDRRDGQDLEHIPFTTCDFLKDSPVRSVWSIVCNPPFNLIKEFCERALEIATYKAAMLIQLRCLPATRWLQRLPLETVYLLTPRPSMPPGSWIAAGNIPGGGSQDFCWLVFNHRMTATAPRLRWLHRDAGRQP
jgi:hypothetical protein